MHGKWMILKIQSTTLITPFCINLMSSSPATSQSSAVFLSSVLHAVIDYSKTLIENILFIHELVVLKENEVLSYGKNNFRVY
jgi:hypothetical protein